MKTIQHGILLNRFNYSETSLILHFFTLEEGFKAFLFKGGKKKKGNLLHPLSEIEITAYHRPSSDLGKISQINALFIPQTIGFHPVKNGLIFYLAEILSSCLYHSDKDEAMFYFIANEIRWLDQSNKLTNYPIWFLIRLSELLGIGINLEDESGVYFNLKEGTVSNRTPAFDSNFYINDESVALLSACINQPKENVLSLSFSLIERRKIRESLLHYFQYHIPNFKPTKTMKVMQEVFE